MKKFLFSISVLFGICVHVSGQNKQLLYDFNEIPQSLMVNPGVVTDFDWYSGVPLLSGLSFQAGSSGISVNDIFADDGIDVNVKIRERAILGMSPSDELSGTYQVELLNFGFRGANPSVFYSLGLYHEGDAIGYWFKDYAILAVEGNADKLNQRFDLGHLRTRGEMLNVFHFGVNKKVNSQLTIGGRAKVYSSILDFNSTGNSGYFVTTEGQNNIFASTINANMELRTSGAASLSNAQDDGNLASTFLKRGLFGGNLGVGVDLGFSYNFNEQTILTASVLDLGFIYHTDNVRSYTLNGSATVEGVEIILPDALADPNRDFWQDLVDEIETFVPFERNSESYISFRPTKLNASLRYNFGKQLPTRVDCDCKTAFRSGGFPPRYTNGIGGQLYMINRPRGPQMALSAFYLRRLGNAMAIKTTYTVDKFSYTNVGLGLNLQAGPVNLYVLADNLLAYRNLADSRYASLQFGLNIISWGRN